MNYYFTGLSKLNLCFISGLLKYFLYFNFVENRLTEDASNIGMFLVVALVKQVSS